MRNQRQNIVFSERVARMLTVLALLIILLLGIIGVVVGFTMNRTQPLQAGIVFGVSTSLIGFVVATGLHSWANELTHRRVLEDALEAQLREVIKEVQAEAYNQIAQQFPKLLPSSYFPPTNVSSPDFEEQLTSSMLASRHYFFRGVTARHVPVYLQRLKPPNLQAHILVLHPQETQQLMLYVMDRLGESDMQASERQALLERVQREMFYSIVGLFDIAHICPISLHLHRGPVFYRTEILDDRCFVAYYVGPRTTYAVTYAYERDTFFYEAFYKDALHLLHVSGSELELNAMTKEEDVGAFLASLGCSASVAELRAEFETFRSAFNSGDRTDRGSMTSGSNAI